MAHSFEAPKIEQKREALVELFKKRTVFVKAFPWQKDESQIAGKNTKLVYLIRHGEGFHNLAQREWQEAKKSGEPYTLDTDPEFRYMDPSLTPTGEAQASSLRDEAAKTKVDLYVTSPFKRAIQTLERSFDPAHRPEEPRKAWCLEVLHEQAGLHTCDKRRAISEIKEEYKWIDFSLVEDNEDPYWGDGLKRETMEHLQERCESLVRWIQQREEKRIVVSTHSTLLFALTNGVLECQDPALSTWFNTGEMRPLVFAF